MAAASQSASPLPSPPAEPAAEPAREPAAEPAREPVAGQRFGLHGVPWWAHLALRDALDDHAGLEMTYLEGALELMSPSMLHEDAIEVIVTSGLVRGENQTRPAKASQAALRAR